MQIKLLPYQLFVFFFICILKVSAQDIPQPMSPHRLVNDFAGIYDEAQKADLEQMLRTYNDTTSTQIYVVTVSDLSGYDVADYAVRIGEKWGVGQKGKNNGIVILIKPKNNNGRGQVYITVGYGIEPILNDARIGRIIDQYMIPHFREDDYYGGTKSAVGVIIQYLSGEFQADKNEDPNEGAKMFIFIFCIIAIVIIISKIKGNNNNGGGNQSSGRGFPPIFPGGGRSSGGGSFGGGFGGGGGGSFGGGGAGRSW